MKTCKPMTILGHVVRTLILFAVFFAGWTLAKDRDFQRGFETGHAAASNQIARQIRRGMEDLQPFYVSEIGFRFAPRGFTITNIKFIGDERAHTARAEVPR